MDEINVYQKILIKYQSDMAKKILYGGFDESEKRGALISLSLLAELQANFLLGDKYE